MKYILLFALFLGFTVEVQSQDYVQHYREGINAYETQNFGEYLYHFQQADSLRPNHRVLIYHLAKAHALNGQPEKAFKALKYRAGFYAVDDFSEDEAMVSLKEPGYQKTLLEMIVEMNKPNKESSKAFEVDIPGFHAEGIAFNESNNRFYLTDIRNGWVYSVGENGSDPKKEIDLKDYGYWSAMGIKFDLENAQRVWVTTSAMANFAYFNDSLAGRSAVLHIDLSKKKLIKSYETEGNHVFGDLIFLKNGSLIVSDSGEPALYKIVPEEDGMAEFMRNHSWWNLQGLTTSQNEKFLYVSDYITGIYTVDLKTKEVVPLTEKNELLRGADGIYLQGDKLITLHNGTSPKRVGSITINKSGFGISSEIRFPDNGIDELDEPTLGVIIGSDLYYIANSPWAHYDENGVPILDEWMPILINKLSFK